MKRLVFILLLLAVGAAGAAYYLRPRALALSPPAPALRCELQPGKAVVAAPGAAFVATVASFDDELYAYFNYDYLRTRRAVQPAEVLLTRRVKNGQPVYPILIRPENNILTAIPLLEKLRAEGYIPSYEWRLAPESDVRRWRQQSQAFRAAYNLPVEERLEGLSPGELQEAVRRFVIFKSRTDPRVRKGIQPVPPTLSEEQAQALASDVITVADFFWLPLDFFLGIGAMENNYMDVPGDLEHAVWKRRPQPGDIVLRRRGGRALVLNNASGVWQITRETLRYAHKLYLESRWDYSLLPAHLRPPEQLDLNEIHPAWLTTYAGLLFRELLDRFGGDVAQAVGAYNGGPANPNMRYEEGVRIVANYARRMVEQAARLNGEAVADTTFLAPARAK